MVLLGQFLYCNTHTLVEPCLISDIWQQKCPVIKSEYVILIMTKLIHGNNYYDEKVKNMLYKCKGKDDDGVEKWEEKSLDIFCSHFSFGLREGSTGRVE